MESLLERYAGRIRGVLSCFDRIVLTESIPDIGYADAMSGPSELPPLVHPNGTGLLRHASFPQDLPNPIRPYGDLDMGNPEMRQRVHDRIGDGGRGSNSRRLANPLRPQRMMR
jgi:hypothetical protein